MALTALTNDVTKTVESAFDDAKGTESAVRFTIGAVSTRQLANIKDAGVKLVQDGNGQDAVQMNGNITAYMTVKAGLRGWDNFKDSDGNDVKIEFVDEVVAGRRQKAVTDKCLDMIPLDVVRELADYINDFNIFTGAEEKKSDK